MSRRKLVAAYPGIEFHSRTCNWWARLTRALPECVHLGHDTDWMTTYSPDIVYLRGKPRLVRRPARPEVSVCRECLLGHFRPALEEWSGRLLALEPPAEGMAQYFFVEQADFEPAGLLSEVAGAISARLGALRGECSVEACRRPARWLWLSRLEIPALENVAALRQSPGALYCARHGAARLCDHFAEMEQANLEYLNLPYGDLGAFLWI